MAAQGRTVATIPAKNRDSALGRGEMLFVPSYESPALKAQALKELRLEAFNTHLYPGLRGAIHDALGSVAAGKRSTCQVVFSDGSATLGTLEVKNENEAVLETGPYTTAAGTRVPAKEWLVALSQDEDGIQRFRIRAKT